MRKTALLFTLFILIGCHSEKTETTPADALFETIPATQSGLHFSNDIENLPDFNIFRYRNFYNGAGAAIADVNNDGLADIFLTANMGPNKLYLNRGDFQFEDISKQAGIQGTKGWSTGVAMVDVNADGWLDIYVCNAGYVEGDDQKNELFINQADGQNPSFREAASDYQLDEGGYTTHTAFFDFDLDGDLDCYILNNSFMPVNSLNYSNNRELYAEDWKVQEFLRGGGDKLLRNDDGKYVDVSKEAGIFGSLIGFGLGITVGDVNGDHWPDLYISNDFFERDYLYINQKDGTFSEEIEQWMSHLSHSSMGADMADLNNDGQPEIFVTEMLPRKEYRIKTTTLFENYNIHQLKEDRGFFYQYMQNTLQLNNGDGTFSEIAHQAGVAATDWSWGALLFDADNDGRRDIYVCNGVYQDVVDQDFVNFFADEVIQKMVLHGEKEEIKNIIEKMPSNPQPNCFFHNEKIVGNTPVFTEKAEEWGLGQPSFSNGAAYGDLDNDGDLDLIVNNLNGEPLLYRNRSNEKLGHHFIGVTLEEKSQNTFSIGAKIMAYLDGKKLTTQLIPTRGFQSSVDYKTLFGLGTSEQVDSLVVIWPDRTKLVVENPPIDDVLNIKKMNPEPLPEAPSSILANASNNATIKVLPSPFSTHTEDGFIDFYQEGLVMRMVSREGPAMATGDVNGDGLDDLYIGGAAGQEGQLWTQKKNGGFAKKTSPTFEQSAPFEDTAARFFDVDGDGDLDLFVGSGGNHHPPMSRPLSDRIYFNEGNGEFRFDQRAIPQNGLNTSVGLPFDMDDDGDLDLFVGSRSNPSNYGVPQRHFIFENNGRGQFRDATRKVGRTLPTSMITDARFIDLLGTGQPQLVFVGEWAAPRIFELVNDVFSEVKSNLNDMPGWWYAIASDDVDGDGDLDLVLGNRGENFYFTASPDSPAKLWLNDMDNNGMIEKIMTRTIDGKDLPLHSKKELTDQLPNLRKQNIRHVDYAKRPIQELFPPEILNQALTLEVTHFQSVIALNEGNGQFTIKPLPNEVQFSCVNAAHFTDVNGDGKNDLLLAGNDHGFLPQYSRLDASFGQTLLNRGDGNFALIPNAQSGFRVRGVVREMVEVEGRNGAQLVVGINNGSPQLFRLPPKKISEYED